MGKLPPGVENHYGSLRIVFQLDGKRQRANLALPPTQANIRSAARLRADVMAAIRAGLFRWSTFFPESGIASAENKSDLFQSVAEDWFSLNSHAARSTRLDHRRALDNVWIPEFGNRPIAAIKTVDIKRVIAARGWRPKRAYNVLGSLRGVFDHAIELEQIEVSPCARLKLQRPVRKKPDPFTQAEKAAILAYLAEHAPGWLNYFDFMFHTGLRTSEAIALRWPQVDLFNGRARIERAHVRHEDKGTKTGLERDVRLNAAAHAAIERQRPQTYLAGGLVFTDPGTGKQIVDDKPPRLAFYRAIKALGIRHRPAYNTRHTYATAGLMAGANPAFMAVQMGHSIKMFLEVYSTWVEGQDSDAQMAKIEAFFASHS